MLCPRAQHSQRSPMLVLIVAAVASAAAAASPREVFVDPLGGDDMSLSGTRTVPVKTVHAAAAVVRELLPGLHHVGDEPLALGPEDGGSGGGWVTWRSHQPALPATVGAPIKVTGWKPHPTIKGALIAPLPTNVTKGSALR